MAYVTTLDNRLPIPKKVLTSESIASGSGTVDFTRMTLDKTEWEAYKATNSLENGDYYLYVYNNNLDNRDEIVNIIDVSTNNMDAGSQIIITCFTKNSGLIGTITETLGAVTAGSTLIQRTKDKLLFDAFYCKIEYNFIKGSSAYTVDVDLIVKKQSAAGSNEELEDIKTAVETIATNTPVINSSQGEPTDLYDLIAESSYSKSFKFILCNVYGEYEVKGGTGTSYVKNIFDTGVYPAEGITKIRKYGGADLLANEIIGYE